MTQANPRRAQGGYALLILLATSAILLAALALSIPRMAMQSQRLKEERLIQRGEEYSRAIKLYFRKHGKYPERLDDLEDTDGVRYLRGRPSDPLGETGEWRLIHMGTDGRFEDSLLFDRERDRRESGLGGFPSGGFGSAGRERDALIQEQINSGAPGLEDFDDQSLQPGQQVPMTPHRAQTVRDSAAPDLVDRGRYNQGFGFDPNQAVAQGPEQPDGEPPDYSRMLPSEVPMNENERNETDPFSRFGQRSRERNPTAGAIGSGSLGQPRGGQRQGSNATAPGTGQPGAAAGGPGGLAAGSGAQEMINRLLTTPRSPGAPIGGAQGAAATPQIFERGIAGVASQAEGSGVKVYNGKEAYIEWEFLFDYRKDPKRTGNEEGTQQGGSPNRRAPGRTPTNPRAGTVR